MGVVTRGIFFPIGSQPNLSIVVEDLISYEPRRVPEVRVSGGK